MGRDCVLVNGVSRVNREFSLPVCRWLTNFYRKPSIYIFLKNRKIWVFKFLTKKKKGVGV